MPDSWSSEAGPPSLEQPGDLPTPSTVRHIARALEGRATRLERARDKGLVYGRAELATLAEVLRGFAARLESTEVAAQLAQRFDVMSVGDGRFAVIDRATDRAIRDFPRAISGMSAEEASAEWARFLEDLAPPCVRLEDGTLVGRDRNLPADAWRPSFEIWLYQDYSDNRAWWTLAGLYHDLQFATIAASSILHESRERNPHLYTRAYQVWAPDWLKGQRGRWVLYDHEGDELDQLRPGKAEPA